MKNNIHLFWLTALMMLFGQSLSAHDFEVDGIYYNYLSQEDKTVSVTYKGDKYYSYSNGYSENVVIPESVTYSGTTYSVTSIGNYAFYRCTGLTSIEIPNSVMSIGRYAFYNCTGLTSIEIPNSVTSIGTSAFRDCTGLTSIEIPNSVTNIGGSAFSGCAGLTSIQIPNSVTSIGYMAFSGCTGLTSIEIPNSVTSIGGSAFWGCTGLTSIEIPNSVTSIVGLAFQSCTGLTSIVVATGNSIYDSRNNCNGIIETATNTLIAGCKNTIIPSSVTSIDVSAFWGCTGLTSIEIPNSVTSIVGLAFQSCTGLTSIVVATGNSVYDSRNNCNAIIKTSTNTLIAGCKNTIIPSSVTSIDGSAFSDCTGLTSIEIPNSVTSIGQNAFRNCTGLTSIEIPSSVTSIGGSAFWGCSSLTSIEIPNSVTSIGLEAFYNCTGLTSITVLSTTPVSINSSTFSNTANVTLYVPKGSKAAYEAANYWKEFKEIVEIEVPIELDITDGEVLVLKHTETCDELVYTRTFANTNWQSLYVPFSIPVDSLSKYGLQVAELNDTHQWDFNGDGVADSTHVEFFTLTSGSTEANYPYLIRATEPTTLSLKLKDIEVKAAEENSIECSSTKQKFTFVGTYTGVSGADMYANNYYGMSGGGLKRVSNNTVSLKPQRWYMKIENKNGSPVNYFAPSIRFTVDGIDEEEEETSAIVDMCTESRNRHKAFYSLEGIRQHTTPTQRGMYVRQDKKLIIR